MPEHAFEEIKSYISELQARAEESQAEALRKLNPLFARNDNRKGPNNFVESSFLYLRSCDFDNGIRPIPCTAFWLSPDLRVASVSSLGMPTRELITGQTYRLTATLRNRGDLLVPSANVEFWLVTPSLGFDTRLATKVGVISGMVMPYSATEVGIDYTVPPSMAGHRCLFARAFSFAPLDIPVDDFALNPVIDRHVAQLNLDIVSQSNFFKLDWIHHRNAQELLEIVPMEATTLQNIRREQMATISMASFRPQKMTDLIGGFQIQASPAKDRSLTTKTKRTNNGIELSSRDGKAISIEAQQSLTKSTIALISAAEKGMEIGQSGRKMLREYRHMTAQTTLTQVELGIPDLGLKPNQGVALHIFRRDVSNGAITGGISLVIVG